MDTKSALAAVQHAVGNRQLTESAADNIRMWLSDSRYQDYVGDICQHIAEQQWQILDDVFWTVIPFGTGGRRGRMYPFGSNAINDRTIGESARGLAEYIKQHAADDANLSCGIAYDTRHRSAEFARLCAEVMAAAGFTVYFLEPHRSTPALSFLVRMKQCSCGIMVTASHNPPSDNAVKCYWSTGGQLLPPHDQGVIDCVMKVAKIPRVPFAEAVHYGKVEFCTAEVDRAFVQAVVEQAFPGPRELKIMYSPLHGVGATAVMPVLHSDGFEDVSLFAPHAEPDGDFPNVPNHVANPENRAVFDAIIEQAQQDRADLIVVTDPDCDRIGVAAPRGNPSGDWETFSGNQIAALLADYVLRQRKEQGTLTPDHYVVKTLVTTDLVRRVADAYGAATIGDLLVGFKWIAGIIDQFGPDNFVFGAEESHGYLVGQYARDKDGAVAAMLFAELAAEAKATGKVIRDLLDDLYWQHGYHAESLINQTLPGSEGMSRSKRLMAAFREAPPKQLAGLAVTGIRDYAAGEQRFANGSTAPLEGPRGELVMLDLSATGNCVAVRPSGTEPKVKYYVFTHVAPEQLTDLDEAKREMADRQQAIERDLMAFAETC